jgi:hypothetical protein
MAHRIASDPRVLARVCASDKWRAIARCDSHARNVTTLLSFWTTTVTSALENGTVLDRALDSTVDDRDLNRGDRPFQIDYFSESRIVVARLCGSFETAGAWERLEAIGTEVRRHAVEGVLVDVRDSKYAPSASDAHAFATYLITFLGRRRLALMPGSVAHYRMARIIWADAALHGVSVKMFRDEQAAATWLRSADPR